MEPIFDKNCTLVAWINLQSGYVFSTQMRYVAFIHGSALFSPRSNHLGYFLNGVFRDTRVGAVAFLRGSSPGAVPAQPAKPVTPPIPTKPGSPATPATPAPPATPSGSFGSTSWEELIHG